MHGQLLTPNTEQFTIKYDEGFPSFSIMVLANNETNSQHEAGYNNSTMFKYHFI